MRKSFAKLGLIIASSTMLVACSSSSENSATTSAEQATSTPVETTVLAETTVADTTVTETTVEDTTVADTTEEVTTEETTTEAQVEIMDEIENELVKVQVYNLRKDDDKLVVSCKITNKTNFGIFANISRLAEEPEIPAGETIEIEACELYDSSIDGSETLKGFSVTFTAEYKSQIAGVFKRYDINQDDLSVNDVVLEFNYPSNEKVIYSIENEGARYEVFSPDTNRGNKAQFFKVKFTNLSDTSYEIPVDEGIFELKKNESQYSIVQTTPDFWSNGNRGGFSARWYKNVEEWSVAAAFEFVGHYDAENDEFVDVKEEINVYYP